MVGRSLAGRQRRRSSGRASGRSRRANQRRAAAPRPPTRPFGRDDQARHGESAAAAADTEKRRGGEGRVQLACAPSRSSSASVCRGMPGRKWFGDKNTRARAKRRGGGDSWRAEALRPSASSSSPLPPDDHLLSFPLPLPPPPSLATSMSGSMSFVPPTTTTPVSAQDGGPHEGQTLLSSPRSPGSPTLVPLGSADEDITGLGNSHCASLCLLLSPSLSLPEQSRSLEEGGGQGLTRGRSHRRRRWPTSFLLLASESSWLEPSLGTAGRRPNPRNLSPSRLS